MTAKTVFVPTGPRAYAVYSGASYIGLVKRENSGGWVGMPWPYDYDTATDRFVRAATRGAVADMMKEAVK